MKKLILFMVTAGITISSYGQLLNGKYSLSSKSGVTTLLFDGEGFSAYNSNDSTFKRFGYFEVNSKTIELYYVNDTSQKSDFQIYTLKSISDAGNIEVVVKDKAGPFEAASISFMDKDGTVPYRLLTDRNGIANILLTKPARLKSLNIVAVGYHNIDIPLTQLINKSTKIDVTMRSVPMNSKKERVGYTIKRKSKNMFDLIDDNGTNFQLKKI